MRHRHTESGPLHPTVLADFFSAALSCCKSLILPYKKRVLFSAGLIGKVTEEHWTHLTSVVCSCCKPICLMIRHVHSKTLFCSCLFRVVIWVTIAFLSAWSSLAIFSCPPLSARHFCLQNFSLDVVTFLVNFRHCCSWQSPGITHYRDSQTSPSGTNIHAMVKITDGLCEHHPKLLAWIIRILCIAMLSRNWLFNKEYRCY